ncbi:hypothetical protein [Fulvimarina sp. MAC3]|uniref:hypothetical protein n=1 Tax=Fulvimarina sp. MAC3 TaxID=3148887 RepID=UPI0031FD10EF
MHAVSAIPGIGAFFSFIALALGVRKCHDQPEGDAGARVATEQALTEVTAR